MDKAKYAKKVIRKLNKQREKISDSYAYIGTGEQIKEYQNRIGKTFKKAQKKAQEKFGAKVVYIGGFMGRGKAGSEKRALFLTDDVQEIVDKLRDYREENPGKIIWCWNGKHEEIHTWKNALYQWITTGHERWTPLWQTRDYIDNLGKFVGGYFDKKHVVLIAGDEEEVITALRKHKEENPNAMMWCRNPEGGDIYESHWNHYQWINNGHKWCQPDWIE